MRNGEKGDGGGGGILLYHTSPSPLSTLALVNQKPDATPPSGPPLPHTYAPTHTHTPAHLGPSPSGIAGNTLSLTNGPHPTCSLSFPSSLLLSFNIHAQPLPPILYFSFPSCPLISPCTPSVLLLRVPILYLFVSVFKVLFYALYPQSSSLCLRLSMFPFNKSSFLLRHPFSSPFHVLLSYLLVSPCSLFSVPPSLHLSTHEC